MRSWLVLGGVVGWLGLAPPAPADGHRYRVSLPGLPPVYVDDGPRQLARFGIRTEFDAPPPPAPGPLPAAPPAPPAPPFELSAAGPAGQGPALAPGPGLLSPEGLALPAGPVDAEVRRILAESYGVEAEGEVLAVWAWYQDEPAALALPERTANAVLRHALATGRVAPPGAVAALEPGAARATVGGTGSQLLRVEPWGPALGTVPAGTRLDLDPPADGVWYRVRAPRPGWVAGLWLRFR